MIPYKKLSLRITLGYSIGEVEGMQKRLRERSWCKIVWLSPNSMFGSDK